MYNKALKTFRNIFQRMPNTQVNKILRTDIYKNKKWWSESQGP